MDSLGPTPEQLNHATYIKPERSRKKNATAYRRESELERMKLDPELYRAGEDLYVQYHGSLGADVRRDDRPTHFGPSDEFRTHACAQKLSGMKNAVCSEMVWEATVAVCALDMSPQYVGQALGGYSNRAQAKAYGDAVVKSGLDILATYLGFKPPG